MGSSQFFCVCLLVSLWGLGLSSCRPHPSAPTQHEEFGGALSAEQPPPTIQARKLTPEQERQLREEESKRQAVSAYPELGVAGTAVNREYVRRYKLYQTVNPAFFDEPDWPKRLAEMLAQDLGLDPRRSGQPAAAP
jgi:hypothetical protein